MRMTNVSPNTRSTAFQKCIGYLDEAHALLSEPPTSKMRKGGWTEKRQAELLRLLEDWRQDFEDDGRITNRHFRIMNRWFLVADVEFESVERLISEVDHTVHISLAHQKDAR